MCVPLRKTNTFRRRKKQYETKWKRTGTNFCNTPRRKSPSVKPAVKKAFAEHKMQARFRHVNLNAQSISVEMTSFRNACSSQLHEVAKNDLFLAFEQATRFSSSKPMRPGSREIFKEILAEQRSEL